MGQLDVLVIYTLYHLTKHVSVAEFCENGYPPSDANPDHYCCNRWGRNTNCSGRGGCCGDTGRKDQQCCDNYVSPVTLGLGIAGSAVVLLIVIFIFIFWIAKKDFAAREVECHCTGCWCEVRSIYHNSGCSRSVQAVNYRHSGYSLDEPTAWRQPGAMAQEPSNDIHPSAPPISRSDAGPSVPPIPNVSENPGAPPPSYHEALDMPRTAAETTQEENPPGYRQAVQVYGVLV